MIHLDEVDSTNSYIKARLGELSDGAAVTARLQTAGRGRRGHEWLADDGMLPLSVLLRNPAHPTTVTLCAGVAVCEALSALSEKLPRVGIKWPNDIIIDGRKVCGILCESVCVGDNMDVICGIGVNISQSAEFFERAGLPHAASLKMLAGLDVSRNALAEDIAERVRRLCKGDFSEVCEEYRRLCLTIGKQVRLIENGTERCAFAEGVADSGFLICRNEKGERFEVNSGEVSVRGLLDYV